jgi:bla regulator protein BlaR1
MIPAINEVTLAISSSLAASIVAKVTVAAAMGLIATWLARGNRATVRHALLASVFGVMLLLPITSIIVPPVHLSVPMLVENRASAPSPSPVRGVELTPPILVADDPSDRVISVRQALRTSLSKLLLTGWIAGGTIFLFPLVIGLWQIRLLRRSALPWRHGQSLADTITLDAGFRRHVEVLLHEAAPGPMTCGIVHPAIVLPPDAESWNEDDLYRAIVHELEHVRRGDSLSSCLARGACAAYWFHPLVWLAWRRLALEAERSCDDAVLRHSEATAYADQLVGLAKRLSAAQRSPLLAMANRADLTTRVDAVLDARQRRGPAGIQALAVACAVAVVLIAAMSPLRLVAAPQAAPAQTGATPLTAKFEVASIRRCGSGGPDFKAGGGLHQMVSPGRLNTGCAVLALTNSEAGLIQRVYGRLRIGQRLPPGSALPILGGPAWIYSDSYVINAEAGGNASEETMEGPMLQALLEDRFKLKIHLESREVPVYALSVVNGDSKLQRFQQGSCVPIDPSNLPPPPPPPGQRNCNAFVGVGVNTGPNIKVEAQGTSLDYFSRLLSLALDRPVTDKTGIAGNFEIHLEFAPDRTTPRFLPGGDMNPGIPSVGAPPATPSDPTGGTSIFTAIQEQLGLKLDPAQGSRYVLVIDSVERPSEN